MGRGILVFAAFTSGLHSRAPELGLTPRTAGVPEVREDKFGRDGSYLWSKQRDAAAVERAVDEAFVDAFGLAMYVAAGMAVMSVVVAAGLVGGKEGRETGGIR